MGTTMTALALVDDDGQEQLALANVGDSRGYLLQRGDLLQVTEDHSLVEELVREGQLTHEEAQVHPQRSIITRALGMEPEIDVDAWTLTPYAGDRILLCSDGLTNEVGTDRIAAILRQLADPQEAARELVRQARANGGNDNITVVVVDVVDDGGKAEEASAALAGEHAHDSAWTAMPREAPEKQGPSSAATATALRTRAVSAPAEPKLKPPRHRRFTWRVLAFLAAFVAILGVVAGSLAWYGRSAYFVALDGNEVAIFKGRPGGFLWFEPTLVEHKAFTTDQVPPAKLDELRAGKEEASRADADRYVNNLRQQASASATTTTEAPATTLPPTTRGTPPT
jgi:protein phosphatase